MPAIRTNAAAAMLGVSPNTLRSWERRYGFPSPRRTAGGHRQYDLAEVESLRAALEETHNVSSAVAVARERGAGPATPGRLRSALTRFDADEADRLTAESLALRSVEGTVEDILLPAAESLAADGADGAEYGFAWRWLTGWLAAQTRVAPPATRPESVLLFDATAPVDVESLHAQALELVLRRAGLRVLPLTVATEPARVARALAAVDPALVVLTGHRASLDTLGRLAFAARRHGGGRVAVLDYRGAFGATRATTVASLPATPLRARGAVLAHLDGRRDATRPPVRLAV